MGRRMATIERGTGTAALVGAIAKRSEGKCEALHPPNPALQNWAERVKRQDVVMASGVPAPSLVAAEGTPHAGKDQQQRRPEESDPKDGVADSSRCVSDHNEKHERDHDESHHKHLALAAKRRWIAHHSHSAFISPACSRTLSRLDERAWCSESRLLWEGLRVSRRLALYLDRAARSLAFGVALATFGPGSARG